MKKKAINSLKMKRIQC